MPSWLEHLLVISISAALAVIPTAIYHVAFPQFDHVLEYQFFYLFAVAGFALPVSWVLPFIWKKLYPETPLREQIHAAYPNTLPEKMQSAVIDTLIGSYVMNAGEDKKAAQKDTVQMAVVLLAYLEHNLPQLKNRGPFRIALIDTIPNIGPLLENLLNPLWQKPELFKDFIETFSANRRQETHKYAPKQLLEGIVLGPSQHPGTPREIVQAYLKGTPMKDVFDG